MHDECISRRMAGMFLFEWAPCQGIKINGSGKIECMASWPSLTILQYESEVRSLQGHWYSLPLSSIMAAMGWPCSFLELSSYILAPLLMMSHVSCKVFAWQGPGKWMHCLMRPVIDHIGRPAPRARARARSSHGSGSGKCRAAAKAT